MLLMFFLINTSLILPLLNVFFLGSQIGQKAYKVYDLNSKSNLLLEMLFFMSIFFLSKQLWMLMTLFLCLYHRMLLIKLQHHKLFPLPLLLLILLLQFLLIISLPTLLLIIILHCLIHMLIIMLPLLFLILLTYLPDEVLDLNINPLGFRILLQIYILCPLTI